MNQSSAAVIDAEALGVTVADVDCWVSADIVAGQLQLSRASGAIDQIACATVDEGVVRMTIGSGGHSSMLADFAETPFGFEAVEGAFIAPIGDTHVSISRDGMIRVASLSSTSGDGSMGGPGLRPGAIVKDGTVQGWIQRFALPHDSGVFGGGESVQGPQLRGRTRVLRNVETSGFTAYDRAYLNVPFFWSPAGWGLFIHTGSAVMADIGHTVEDVLSIRTTGECLDLFFIEGSAVEVLQRFHHLTGRPGSVPAWALGTWMSRCSYFSEAEIHSVLDDAEAAGCRIDVINVDAWQTGNVLVDLACNWEPDERRFPPGWVGRLRSRGVRVSLWHNPYIPAHSVIAQEALAGGLFAEMGDGSPAESADIPGRLLLDFTNAGTVTWWAERVTTLVATEGIAAIKTDFGEEVPEDAIFADGRRGGQLRNEYAHLYQQASALALAAATPDGEPPIMFVRSGTAGSQRYPCHWVGDSASTWGGMTSALRSALSLSLSGFAWVSHDVGGFWVAGSDAHLRASREEDPSPFEADVDAELYVRWTQWGAFSPVLRFHGAGRREPFAYPAPYGHIAVDYTKVRQAMRTYLTGCSARTAATGLPIMRPMALAFPRNSESHDSLQYMLGDDVLVAPIVRPGGQLRMWLPDGEWASLLGDTCLPGGWHTLHVPLEEFPAFIRADRPVTWLEDFSKTLNSLHPTHVPA